MKFIHWLVAIVFTLPLLAASDDIIRRRDEPPRAESVQSVGLKGSSERNEPTDQESSRHLTWSHHSWWSNRNSKKKKKNRKPKIYGSGGYGTTAACNCNDKWETFEFSAILGVAIASAPSVSDIGGKYIYNSPLFRDTALSQPFQGNTAAFVSGDCTRFQNLETLADGNRILGAGLCTYVLSVVTSNLQGSMVLQGELFDVIPSTLSITGGTEDFDGARGNVVFTPSYDNGGTDVFTEASHVELTVDARVLDRIL